MITINEFLALEGNDYTKELLLETIQKLAENNNEKKELSFNVYSVTFYPKKKEVLISDDICPEENPAVTVPLDEFYKALQNFKTN